MIGKLKTYNTLIEAYHGTSDLTFAPNSVYFSNEEHRNQSDLARSRHVGMV